MLCKLLIACVGVAAVVAAAGADEKQKVKYPKLQAALWELREAKAELEASKVEDGGKKKKALEAIHEASVSLKVILAVKGDTTDAAHEKDYYKAYKDHPHLRAALADLKEARRELNDAETDFQGNRKEALKKIDEAIDRIGDLLEAVKRR